MKIRGIAIRINPLFLVVAAVAAYGHALPEVMGLFFVVILHELGHVLAAAKLGYQTETIELLPFGGVARLRSGHFGFTPSHETIIAICGPLVNLALALGGALLHLCGLLSGPSTQAFVTLNLTLLFFNLLPGLPLDGGRIARAGLARSKGYFEATKVVTRMSFLLSAALMTVGFASLWLGYADAGLLLLGFFLLVSAYTASKQTRYDLLRFLDTKRRERGDQAQPIQAFAVGADTSIADVAARLSPGSYHVIYVRTDHAQADAIHRLRPSAWPGQIGVVSETQLLDAVFLDSKWTEPVADLVQT
ncbi:MAG: site-2 protease family protein [Firmicutes bacterium]|nr:site-2 protease family protein [Bacillota bacterium]